MKRTRINHLLRRMMTLGWMPWVEDELVEDAETQRRLLLKDSPYKDQK